MRSVTRKLPPLLRKSSSFVIDARISRFKSISTHKLLSKFQALLKSVMARSALATEAEYKMIRSALMMEIDKQEDGRVYIGRSTAFEGGRGVFANRDLEEGELCCLYAGVVFPQPPIVPSFTDVAGKVETVFPAGSNDYIINLGESGAGYIEGDKHLDDHWRCGQLINHPPQGTPVNTMMLEFAWSRLLSLRGAEEERRLREIVDRTNKLHQGLWYITETGEKVHTPSLGNEEEEEAYYHRLAGAAMVTTRKVKRGEELWFDYELNEDVLSEEMAQWYTSVPPSLPFPFR